MGTARAPSRTISRLWLAALTATLALLVTGCGGGDFEYQEVPGAPAEITLPESSEAEPTAEEAASDDEAAAEGEATATPEATETPAAGTEGAAGDTAGETQVPAAVEDGPDSDQPPAPGTDAERFEDFCEQNAGAC